MKISIVTETLTNLQIAERQLDRSIQLFLVERDFVSSLTLAGAAEEILGKLLNLAGTTHVLGELIDASIAFYEAAEGPVPDRKVAEKEIANIANFYRNKLKHYNENEALHFSVDYFAAEMIDRAISNYWKYTQKETTWMRRFKEEVMLGIKTDA